MFKALAVLCLLLPGQQEHCVLEAEAMAGPFDDLETCKAHAVETQQMMQATVALPVPWRVYGLCLPADPPAAPETSRPA